MDFIAATDRLMAEGVSLNDVARALGVSYGSVKAARLDASSGSHRPPPPEWRAPLAKLARGRGERLAELAEELEG